MLNIAPSHPAHTRSKERESFYIPSIHNGTGLPVSPFTLRFIGNYRHFENIYKEQSFVRYLPLIRGCHWMGIFLYSVFGILDVYLFPENSGLFLFIRLGVVCPLFLLGLAFSYAPWYRRISTFMLTFFVLLTAGGYTLMSSSVPVVYSFGYYIGLVACLIFGYTFIRLPFLNATAAGWIVIWLYWVFGNRAAGSPESVFTTQIAYLVGINFLLMIICYAVERSDRQNFFLSQLLVAEREKVNRINTGLEETVRNRTLDLEAANLQLSQEIEAHRASQYAKEQLAKQLRQAQKMEAIGTLAGGIAHDFNNILGSIIGFAELAMDDAPEGSQQHENIEEVLVAGKRARDLVKQILAFSRRGEQSMRPVVLDDIAKEAHVLLRATIPASITIELIIHATCKVLADPTQLNQVIMNLGINAAQAIEPQSGRIRILIDEAQIDQDFSEQHPDMNPGPHALLLVEDTGKGIASEILDRIYDPFFTTKPQGKGTGLGLSVVHGIVKNHGGTIIVSSRPAEGTSFSIYMPLYEKNLPAAESVDPLPVGGQERILFIDDERPLLNYSSQALSKMGYLVETRDNAFEALELFKAKHTFFDLVITDMTMPFLNGDALSLELKKIRSDLPIILCSGLNTSISRQKMVDIGVDEILFKPISKVELARTVRRVLDQSMRHSDSAKEVKGSDDSRASFQSNQEHRS